MINIIKEQRLKNPRLCEIIRFLVIGGMATILDMTIMGIFIYMLNKNEFNNQIINVFIQNGNISTFHVILGNALGFTTGLIFNYFFSIIYVYNCQSAKAKSKKGFTIFTIFSLIGLGIQTLGIYIMYSTLGINKWLSKMTLVLLVLCFNYITRKLFIFK